MSRPADPARTWVDEMPECYRCGGPIVEVASGGWCLGCLYHYDQELAECEDEYARHMDEQESRCRDV